MHILIHVSVSIKRANAYEEYTAYLIPNFLSISSGLKCVKSSAVYTFAVPFSIRSIRDVRDDFLYRFLPGAYVTSVIVKRECVVR
jgi:hypothetical protein